MTDDAELPSAARRVAAALRSAGIEPAILQTPDSTRTAEQAAAVIGVEVGQIVKSMVLRTAETDRAVLVLTSGANRVDLGAVAREIGEPVKRADADFVRARTVARSAAGTPHAVFPAEPDALVAACGARVTDLAERKG